MPIRTSDVATFFNILLAVCAAFPDLPAVRRWLAPAGAVVVLVAALFPGESRQYASPFAPLHFVLGVGSYGLFGAAVLHAALLDSAERRLRSKSAAHETLGIPLLQLERLTFRFVEAGFAVLSAALLLGYVSTAQWRWDHKTVFSLLGWLVFQQLPDALGFAGMALIAAAGLLAAWRASR